MVVVMYLISSADTVCVLYACLSRLAYRTTNRMSRIRNQTAVAPDRCRLILLLVGASYDTVEQHVFSCVIAIWLLLLFGMVYFCVLYREVNYDLCFCRYLRKFDTE